MALSLSSSLAAFTNAEDPAQLQELERTLELAFADGLSQEDKVALLGVFERFPEDDGFGIFWSILHAIEAADNYEKELVSSVRRAPNLFNTVMVNRIFNSGSRSVAEVPIEQLLREVLHSSTTLPSVAKQVTGFLKRQAEG